MIIIIGSIKCRPETHDELRRESLEHVTRSLTEDGCLEHSVQIDCENSLTLFFFERWRDQDAVWKHFAQPDSRSFSETARRLAAEPPSIRLFVVTSMSIENLVENR